MLTPEIKGGRPRGLSQRYNIASEATLKYKNRDDTFSEILLSRHHAPIKYYRLERS